MNISEWDLGAVPWNGEAAIGTGVSVAWLPVQMCGVSLGGCAVHPGFSQGVEPPLPGRPLGPTVNWTPSAATVSGGGPAWSPPTWYSLWSLSCKQAQTAVTLDRHMEIGTHPASGYGIPLDNLTSEGFPRKEPPSPTEAGRPRMLHGAAFPWRPGEEVGGALDMPRMKLTTCWS